MRRGLGNRAERLAGLGRGNANNPYISQNDYGEPESDHEGGIDSDEEVEPRRMGRGRGRGGNGRGGRGAASFLSRKRPTMSFVSGGVTGDNSTKKPKPNYICRRQNCKFYC